MSRCDVRCALLPRQELAGQVVKKIRLFDVKEKAVVLTWPLYF